jgi:hypothetical protein
MEQKRLRTPVLDDLWKTTNNTACNNNAEIGTGQQLHGDWWLAHQKMIWTFSERSSQC